MNVAAAGLCMAICTFAGYMRSYRMEERRRVIYALLSDCMMLTERIDYTAEPIAHILKNTRLSHETKLFWDTFINEIESGRECSFAWERAYSSAALDGVLTDDEAGELGSFFTMLGRADRAGERKNAVHICEALKAACDRTDKDARTHIKLCRSLGALAGLGLAILII